MACLVQRGDALYDTSWWWFTTHELAGRDERAMIAIAPEETTERCVGRGRELTMLRDAYHEASEQGERLVLIRGPEGVGKSWLMADFRRRMRLDGAVLLEGRCCAGAPPLSPLVELLRRALAFLQEVGHSPEQLVDIDRLAFLLGDGGLSGQADVGLTPIEQRIQFFEVYCDVLRAVSRFKPPVIMVHDLHWADTMTVELLTHLLDGGPSWSTGPEQAMFGLVVASTRTGGSAGAARSLAFHPKVQVLELTGFDETAVREFLQTSQVIQRLTEVTGGNPAELRALLQAPSAGADEVLRHTVTSLGDEARQLLESLAVLGRASTVRRVIEVAGATLGTAALSELQASGLVVKSLHRGELTLRMARAHYSDKVYDWLEPERLRALHSRAAELLRYSTGLEVQELALHAIKAGEGELAVEASLRAAEALEAAYAYEAAANLLEEVCHLAEGEQAIVISQRLAELCHRTGQYEQALRHARIVYEAKPDDPTVGLTVGRLMVLTGDFDEASDLLEKTQSITDGAVSSDLQAELSAVRAEMLFRRAKYDEALRVCDEGMTAGAEAYISMRNVRGKVELARGRFDEARQIFEGNLEKARSLGNPRLEAQSLINLGIVLMRDHHHGRASQCLESALTLAERIHDLRESALALENLGVLAHLRCDLGAALSSYHAALSSLKPLGNAHLQVRAAQNLGELYLMLNDVERAQRIMAYAEQLGGTSRGNFPPEVKGEGLLLAARIALAKGEIDAAMEFLTESKTIFEGLDSEARLAEINLTMARLELRRSDVIQAKTYLEAVCKSEGIDQGTRAEAAMVEAEIESARFGDPIRPLLHAIECFRATGDAEGGWKAHLELAITLGERDDGEGRRRHLEQAIELERKVRETVPSEFREVFVSSPHRCRLQELAFSCGPETTPIAVEPPPETAASRPATPPPSPPPQPLEVRRVSSVPPPSPAATNQLRERFQCQFPDLIWKSSAMAQLLAKAEKVARGDSQVLILGESGTGKELIAEVIHRLSDRRSRPNVKVNCAALVETLLLDELFGHEKGAFTGALQLRKGRFEMAHSGSLFLDEIGDISPKTQVSLLRVLQEQVFERVGGIKPINADVRLICATNRDLAALVAEGTFREDLYYRLKGITLEMPPLRERPEDIELLAQHFLARDAQTSRDVPKTLSSDALDRLVDHSWPGNIRELENVIRSVSLMVDGPEITAEAIDMHSDLREVSRPTPTPTPINTASPVSIVAPASLDRDPLPLDTDDDEAQEGPSKSTYEEVIDGELSLREWQKQLERGCIEKALERTGWNITRAAKLLGMKRPRLSQLVKEHELNAGRQGS